MAVKEMLFPVVRLLANGSIDKAVDTLFTVSKAQTSKAVTKRLTYEIKALVGRQSSLVQSGGKLDSTSFSTGPFERKQLHFFGRRCQSL